MSSDPTPSEMMVVTAARALSNDDVCFVGIGAPSEACNLARLTHAPDITLIYESGTIGARPDVLSLSIGDGELCDSALTTVSVPATFQYWLQGGRISIGFLGACPARPVREHQYHRDRGLRSSQGTAPRGRGCARDRYLCEEVYVITSHTTRGLVAEVDFITWLGFGRDGEARERFGLLTKGPTLVITDLCVLPA